MAVSALRTAATSSSAPRPTAAASAEPLVRRAASEPGQRLVPDRLARVQLDDRLEVHVPRVQRREHALDAGRPPVSLVLLGELGGPPLTVGGGAPHSCVCAGVAMRAVVAQNVPLTRSKCRDSGERVSAQVDLQGAGNGGHVAASAA